MGYIFPKIGSGDKPVPLSLPYFKADGDNQWDLANREKTFRIGLFIPMCGAAGIWGPSCIASAQVAVSEINAQNGIGDKEVELVLVDAAMENENDFYQLAHDLIERREIHAIVGMHLSAVRQKLVKIVAGRIPYIYTPLYEGGEVSPGVFTIGETPEAQLGPAIYSISQRHKVKNWALIGNDYVWPRASHAYAKRCIKALGGSLTMERYLPFDAGAPYRLIEELSRSNTDALLVSLIGQDAVVFNRAFGNAGLDRKIIRLSCVIEENTLLAIGSKNLKRLYTSASYFSVLRTPQNNAFKEKYYGLHGISAPLLNSLGQSLYEGVHFLSSLMENASPELPDFRMAIPKPLNYRSARGATFLNNQDKKLPIYLARADGHAFSVVENIS